MIAKRTQYLRTNAEGEQGFILIVTMLILVVLTVLCIGALDNSSLEVQIAANDRQSRVAFNLADGGTYAAAKLIGQTIIDGAVPTYPGSGLDMLSFLDPTDPDYSSFKALDDSDVDLIVNGGNDFYERVISTKAPRTDGKYDFMLRAPNAQGDLFVRIVERNTEFLEGSSSEYGAATEGAGAGSTGGVAFTYDLDVDSFTARNARSRLAVRYRKVSNTAGGL